MITSHSFNVCALFAEVSGKIRVHARSYVKVISECMRVAVLHMCASPFLLCLF